MPQHISLRNPFRTFLNRLRDNYAIGASPAYDEAIQTAKGKYCFNPFITSECDVQVKLGGIIEEYLLTEHLPFTVHAEMKIYGQKYKSHRSDLTLQHATTKELQTSQAMTQAALAVAIEIKYANAVHPDAEYKNGAIVRDINKLLQLGPAIDKYMVVIDEADQISETNMRSLVTDCTAKNIILLTNNSVGRAITQHYTGYEW